MLRFSFDIFLSTEISDSGRFAVFDEYASAENSFFLEIIIKTIPVIIEIGEYIMFLHNGKKIWEGNNKNILKTKVKELNEFVFSNKLMKKLR